MNIAHTNKKIDTLDYTPKLVEYAIQIGGLAETFKKEIKEEIITICKEVLLVFMEEEQFTFRDDTIFIESPIQVIPDLLKGLIKKNIAVYSVIPL